MAKENIESCGKKNPSAREIELEGEVVSLKHQIGGLKTSNVKYRDQVEELKKQLAHYKAVDVEGDELYEKKIKECEELQKRLETAQITIYELRAQASSYEDRILEYVDRTNEMKVEIENLHTAIEYEQKPWWKKLFNH